MRYVAVFVVLMLVSAVLAACERILDIDLLNNTGDPIAVRAGGDSIPVAPGRSGEFHYPQSEANWTLLISAGACEYLYQLPRALKISPDLMDRGITPRAQVERDFSIWLVPSNASGVADVSGPASQQDDGFPLRPVSRTCH
ncbi:MAG TPA: hypothetical protein VHC39_16325 [Rhizomicrobium sp.]|nr:hypothetical protein [Rhizomicrobium sp.]